MTKHELLNEIKTMIHNYEAQIKAQEIMIADLEARLQAEYDDQAGIDI